MKLEMKKWDLDNYENRNEVNKYWYVKEEKQFVYLIRLYGNNPVEISKHFKSHSA
jgi:hypothetical protein